MRLCANTSCTQTHSHADPHNSASGSVVHIDALGRGHHPVERAQFQRHRCGCQRLQQRLRACKIAVPLLDRCSCYGLQLSEDQRQLQQDHCGGRESNGYDQRLSLLYQLTGFAALAMTARHTSLAACCVCALALTACANGGVADVKRDVVRATVEVKNSPQAPVQRTMTNFDDALVCMDMLMIDNGIRDVVVLTEDIVDSTTKANVGTRDMLISAVSDMTRRSHAIRLITFGADAKNLQEWLVNSGGHANVYNFQPTYNIRGSLSQLDEGLASGQSGLDVQLGPLSGGKQRQASSVLLGLDLSMMSARTMELLPGVASRNSVILQRSGKGVNVAANLGGQAQGQQAVDPAQAQAGGLQGTADNLTLGISYNFNVNRSEGIGGGVRNLVELATIELFGKLLRVPYWQCLGVQASHPMVQREMGDWYFNLQEEGKLVAYMQNQLRIMGRYNGPANGQVNKEFRDALKDLAARNNMAVPEVIDAQLFSYVVNLPNKNTLRQSKQLAHFSDDDMVAMFAKKQKNTASRKKNDAKDKKPLARSIQLADKDSWHPIAVSFVVDKQHKAPRMGDPLSIQVTTSEDAYLYCYLTSEKDGATMRVFPNPRLPDAWVGANQMTTVPGDASLGLPMVKALESLACFASDTDAALAVGQELVGSIEMQGRSVDKVRAAIANSADASFGEARLVLNRR